MQCLFSIKLVLLLLTSFAITLQQKIRFHPPRASDSGVAGLREVYIRRRWWVFLCGREALSMHAPFSLMDDIAEWNVFLLKTEAEEGVLNKKRSKKTEKKYKERQKTAKVEQALEEQFMTGRCIGEYDLARF